MGFVVFFTLLALGYAQTKERVVKVKTVFILPFAMILFSFFGVYSVFGITSFTVGIWFIGFVLTLLVGAKLAYPRFVIFSEQNNKLTIPGSWVLCFL